ncbi:amidase domain-containing protein [Paenibacillus arenilitoris]|uniref:Amidase domain-containing protein n=1 Tax=Paenibacillus arenilitoris TaxID=2772299 RepID=A0A927CPB9_9BACL|nr:amidase domain-containing protein [Paenibacillus arenilitoris]MBD2871239.1 amidase domain-containing protein [Paenibacillus arenilitoris]
MPRTGNRGPGSQVQKRNQTPSKPLTSIRKQPQQKAVAQPEPGGTAAAKRQEALPAAAARASGRPGGTSKSSLQPQPKLQSLLRSSDYDKNRQQGAQQGWKSSVHRYVGLYNQAETDQHASVLTDYVTDRDHCDRLRHRLERLRERDLLRGALPAGSETKAELVRVNESATEVSVMVRLHIKRRMEQSGRYYIEERSEYERLWLGLSGGAWEVLRVEPIIAERRPRYGTSIDNWMTVDDYSEPDGQFSSPSTPYLNYDLIPQFKHRPSGIRYRRDLAAAYADRWWNEGNPSYELFEVNCTHYVSQCLFAGNAPMNYTGKRETGWWYKGRNKGSEWWSYSWAVSNALTNYLTAARTSGLRAEVVRSADELQLGDVITYDWNGDHRFQHSTIVTAFDSQGMPLVNANTVASRHRYWDYRDSYAWTEQTKYRFFHINDLL